MNRIFITGVSGYFGLKLVEHLSSKEDVGEIIGIDIVQPRCSSAKLTFIRHDVRSDMYALLKDRAVDWAIHAAYILPPIHNKSLMEDININGTKNFLSSCLKAGIPQLLQCSSATAYGFHPDNDVPLTEESPLRGNEGFTYAKNKRELEEVCALFQQENPGVSLAVIRPCFVVGPGFDNPLSRHLRKKIVMLPSDTAPFQFIHENDLVEIIYLLLKEKRAGAYNLAADGTMSFDEMIHILGNRQLKLPYPFLYVTNNLMWYGRVKFMTEFPSAGIKMLVYPWIASNDKLKRELGYTFQFTTREAFDDFARYVKENKASLISRISTAFRRR
jgi:UDP-glucose 4-epimerase